MALLFTVLCGAVAITLGYFINYFAQGHFVHSTRAVLDAELRYVESLGEAPATWTHNERIYLLLDDDGSLPNGFPQPEREFSEGILIFNLSRNDQAVRYAAHIYNLPDSRKILIGTDITAMSRDFDFMQLIGLASIAFVMIVVFVSYMISIFVVNGTNQIAETAHDIIRTGDLSRRVEMQSRWDDLGNVAGLLNLLFGRIEELMQGVRQVSDNIAHDLRTPLTRMRNHIEVLQQKDESNEDYAKLLSEADHILSTFNALLRISRIETERQRSHFTSLDLHALLDDVASFYEPLAEERDISLSKDLIEAEYYGDRDLLFQVYANLLDNAIKFTPAGGQIRLIMKRLGNKVHVEVIDSGAGVDEAEVSKVFDRFYRAEKSRTTTGSGLGLSLAAAAISLHGEDICAENTQHGFKIVTIL